MKPIEFLIDSKIKTNFKTRYIRFRTKMIKHELWLRNRKRKDDKILFRSDKNILDQCQEGSTAFFDSAGYYIKDLFPSCQIDVIESSAVVKEFYPDAIHCTRNDLPNLGSRYDNFIVTNSRSDHWTTMDGLALHFLKYVKVMRPGCKFFYSFRDTQMLGFNRLKTNLETYFVDWATNLSHSHGLILLEHDVQFPKKLPNRVGEFDLNENPDTTNGNVKLVFQFQGKS